MNPYMNRVMIQRPEDFVGRRSEVRRVLSRIGGPRPQSVSVAGERRIGKSSLLQFLLSPESRREQAVSPALTLLYFDLQKIPRLSPEAFFDAVVREIQLKRPDLSPVARSGYAGFQSTLDSLEAVGGKLTLLLDEFEIITASSEFDVEFYSFLRSSANNYDLGFVTASNTELQRLCHSSEVADSPFFNIFGNLKLRPFQREEARELVCEPSEREGLPLAPFFDRIEAIAGLFPFYLQIACCALFDYLTENSGEDPDWTEIADRFLEEAGPHFEYFWEHQDPGARRVLRALLGGRQPKAEDFHILRRLERDGYVVSPGDSPRLFSALFGEYIDSVESLGDRSAAIVDFGTTQSFEMEASIQQYRIEKKVASGGMGVVYRGLDTRLGRPVALKVIRPQLLHSERLRRRFLKEAKLTAALRHPSITAVYECLEYKDQILLVLEWLEGQTLRELLKQGPRPGWQDVVRWLADTCDGLAAAHDLGIIHRDIKSSNLLITPAGEVRILDFGLARHDPIRSVTASSEEEDLTESGAVIGTLYYMSPEQASGAHVDTRTDLFSLGVVGFEALTNELPFRKPTQLETLNAITQEPVPDLALYGTVHAAHLNPVLKKLMAKEPDDRYQSAREAAQALRKLHQSSGPLGWLRHLMG